MERKSPLTALRDLAQNKRGSGEERERKKSHTSPSDHDIGTQSQSQPHTTITTKNSTPENVMDVRNPVTIRIRSNIPFFLSGTVALISILVAIGLSVRAKPSNYTWYLILSNLIFYVGATFAVLSGGAANLRLVLLAMTTSAFTLITKETNDHITLKGGVSRFIGGSFIVMSLAWMVWIIIFGIESGPMALNGGRSIGVPAIRNAQKRKQSTLPEPDLQEVSVKEVKPQGRVRSQVAPEGRIRSDSGGSVSQMEQSVATPVNIVVVRANAEYPQKALAKYTYQANASDPNELSFKEGEILEVTETGGKWWQAKNSAGVVGIAPSNYLDPIS